MVSTSTILRDTIFYVKNFLSGNVSDPISNRPTGQNFIFTSYPTSPVTYPIITVKDRSSRTIQRLGFQSTQTEHAVEVEVRVWSNNVVLRDKLADSIHQQLKDNQFTASTGQIANNLHDFGLISSVNVDDPEGFKSKVMTFRWIFIAT